MPRTALTGSRIRARRIDLGLKQAALARACDISPSYLNLIEHNRRRIGGKLLVDIASELGIDQSLLREGAETALTEALGAAAAAQIDVPAEREKAEEFAGRFPGWARLIEKQALRVEHLERVVETLNDRLTHDPFLSASMHDVLSTVTAIQSTSSILADDGAVDPEWQARFHHNLFEDSQRLADSAGALVSYLDAGGDAEREVAAPQEELEAWLSTRGWHLPELEGEVTTSVESLVAGAVEIKSSTGRALATRYLTRYTSDAQKVPLADLQEFAPIIDIDPSEVAVQFGVDLPTALRRIACLPASGGMAAGLVTCDGSGTLTFRKPVSGFALPRFGAACPLWPLYVALQRPMTPLRMITVPDGRDQQRFRTHAISTVTFPAGYQGPQLIEATMLILPEDPQVMSPDKAHLIGTSCRICPRETCAARREPSILAEGF